MAPHRPGRHRRPLRTGSLILALIASTCQIALLGAPASAAEASTLPVYQVRSAGLTPNQVAALGKALGLRRVDRAADGSVRFAAENGFLAVPTKTTGRGEDEDGNLTTTTVLDLPALKKLRPISGKKALDRVKRALTSARLVPAGGRAKASNTTLRTVDAKGRPTASAALDTTVGYSFTLGGLPYQGPGAKVRVGFDARGAVTSLAYSTRTLVKSGSVRVLDSAAARQRCAEGLGDAVRISGAVPAYFAPALSVELATLEPSFRCSGVNGDGSAAQVVFVPAAVDAVLPEMPAPPPPRAEGAAPSARAFHVADVASEGTGPCSGLAHTGENLASFNGQFTGNGIPVEFSWNDQNAWEDDFKDPLNDGHDSSWTDHVDMTYWQGHGSPTGFSFSGCSSHDDSFLANTDARWGNGDAEWMSLFTCLILAQNSGGQQWWQRWGPAFDGLHQINSFHTISYHSASHGGTYAHYLLRSPFLWWNNPMPVRSAWAQASIDDQPSDVVWASMGVIGAGGSVNLNDYFWGKGPVGPDVPASGITGYWYLSGSS